MNRLAALTAATLCLVGIAGALTLLARHHGRPAPSEPDQAWTEVKWPFPLDQWGRGKAYRCAPAGCGAEVTLYLRAKLGFCNCDTGVADDDDLHRMSDFDLVGGEVAPLGAGRPIAVGAMKGRSRAYALAARNATGETAISIAFSDRCDMVVATAVLPHARPEVIESRVVEFLNSRAVLHWAELALGL